MPKPSLGMGAAYSSGVTGSPFQVPISTNSSKSFFYIRGNLFPYCIESPKGIDRTFNRINLFIRQARNIHCLRFFVYTSKQIVCTNFKKYEKSL